ncbi:hypothetical protein JQK15_20245 [Sphingobium sp. BHU LFT2]|nr:hypothetical protein [Sphingobium sp. BHU LFT2]
MLAKTDDSRLAAGLIRPAPATDKQAFAAMPPAVFFPRLAAASADRMARRSGFLDDRAMSDSISVPATIQRNRSSPRRGWTIANCVGIAIPACTKIARGATFAAILPPIYAVTNLGAHNSANNPMLRWRSVRATYMVLFDRLPATAFF